MNKTTDDLLHLLIKNVLKLLALIPRNLFVQLAVPIGLMWYSLDLRHRKIAMNNMKIAFGDEITYTERLKLVKSNFIQLTRVILEIPSMLNLNRKNLSSYVTFEGKHHLSQALSKGTGVLLLTAHLGNWELMALAGSLEFNIPVNVLIRPLDFPAMDRVLSEIRSRTGNQMIDKNNSAGIVSRMLDENKVVGILLDQNSSWYEGVYVPFFRRIVCTNKGLAMMALRYRATVIPVFNMRKKDGRYRIIIEKPLNLVRTGSISDDILENTAFFNRIIEKYIRMAPDNWLWVHRRWRIKEIPERVRRKIR